MAAVSSSQQDADAAAMPLRQPAQGPGVSGDTTTCLGGKTGARIHSTSSYSECWTGEAEQPLLHPPANEASCKQTPQRGVHRGQLKLLFASDRAGGRRPSSGCTNVTLSVFSKVHLHEHSGDNDRGVVIERSQRKMASFGPRDSQTAVSVSSVG
ncbi:hypothetical protein MTO96_003317 [Rhipicephalus appendiculatus]